MQGFGIFHYICKLQDLPCRKFFLSLLCIYWNPTTGFWFLIAFLDISIEIMLLYINPLFKTFYCALYISKNFTRECRCINYKWMIIGHHVKPWWHCQGCIVVLYYYRVYYHDLVLLYEIYFTIIMHKPQPSSQYNFQTCQVSSISSCQCEIKPHLLIFWN